MKTQGTLSMKTKLKPIIVYENNALERVQYMVAKNPKECQWWHRVERLVEEGKGVVLYFIHDLFIPRQIVDMANVETDGAEMMKMWKRIMKDRGFKNMGELSEVTKTATVWCHSHHTMTTSPSGTDDQQWKEQKENGVDNTDQPQIMMIVNKKNECFNRVWDPILNIEFEKVEIQVKPSERFKDLDAIMKECFIAPEKQVVKKVSNKDKKDKKDKPANHGAECVCPLCKEGGKHRTNCQCADCKKK